MKRNLLLLAAALGFASVSFGQTSYGVKAGLTFPKVVSKESNVSYSSSYSTSFYLTGYVDASLSTNFSIQPGLSLQGKGGKLSASNSPTNEVIKDDYLYLEVPVNFVYYISAGPGDILVGAGPYAGFGLSAKSKMGNRTESGSFKDANLNVFDAGVNFLAGYELIQGFSINGGYSLGLTNIFKDADGWSLKNRVFSVGVGYQF